MLDLLCRYYLHSYFLSFSFCFIFWEISWLVIICLIFSYFSHYIFTSQEFFGSLSLRGYNLLSHFSHCFFLYVVGCLLSEGKQGVQHAVTSHLISLFFKMVLAPQLCGASFKDPILPTPEKTSKWSVRSGKMLLYCIMPCVLEPCFFLFLFLFFFTFLKKILFI